MANSIGQLATSLVSRNDARSQTALLPVATAWPSWADEAVEGGEANAYFDAEAAARKLLPVQRDNLAGLIKLAEAKLKPMDPEAAPQFADVLLVLACRIQPGLGEETGNAWAASTVESLSRFPTDIVARAVDNARYRPFRFLNEVAPWLHEYASDLHGPRARKANRLRQVAEAAKKAAEEKPKWQPTADELAAIKRAAGLKDDAPGERKTPRELRYPKPGEVEALSGGEKIGGLSPAIQALRERMREAQAA